MIQDITLKNNCDVYIKYKNIWYLLSKVLCEDICGKKENASFIVGWLNDENGNSKYINFEKNITDLINYDKLVNFILKKCPEDCL